MTLLPLIILSSAGLAACLCYLIYQAVLKRRSKTAVHAAPKEERFEYYDCYEEGDSLVIDFKNQS